MKRITSPHGLFLGLHLGILIVSTSVWAQESSKSVAADERWGALSRLSRQNVPRPDAKKISSPADYHATAVRQAALSAQVAQSARDFYHAYPDHPNAAKAKKIEAIASLQASLVDGSEQEVATGEKYRTDLLNAKEDRFEVAQLSEMVQLSQRLNISHFSNRTADLEKIADKLHSEFGEMPQVYRFYAAIANGADMETSVRLAKLLKSPSAPPDVLAASTIIEARQTLVGHALRASVTSVDGKRISLGMSSDRPTIIYIWSATRNPGSVAAERGFSGGQVAGCNWTYVSLNSNGSDVAKFTDQIRFAGIQAYVSPEASTEFMDEVMIRQIPYAFITNRNGIVTGCGPIAEIPALVARAKQMEAKQ